ncbi:hypothetical protein EG329_013632 [Mollisiaceae sp. DMI_Dod_QoI]|nr:hypothetical protein EG329_013632 [Helotiales sp. DMI_Dod_QoI]
MAAEIAQSGFTDRGTTLQSATKSFHKVYDLYAGVERQEIAASSLEAKHLEPKFDLEGKPWVKTTKAIGKPLSSSSNIAEQDVSRSPKVLKERNLRSRARCENLPDILTVLDHDSEIHVASEYLISSTNASGNLALETLRTADMPRSHGKSTPYKVLEFLERGTEDTQILNHRPSSHTESDHSSIEQSIRPRRLNNHSGSPRIRRARTKSSVPAVTSSVDSARAPGSDDYWAWDEAVEQYHHIDSDTASIYWYEDSESGDSLKAEPGARAGLSIPGTRETAS